MKQNLIAFIALFVIVLILASSVCVALAILCSLLAGKSHSLVLNPGHISFCFYCEGDIPLLLPSFRFEVFGVFVVCAPQLHPFVAFALCVVFGMHLSTLKHDGILVNQRTSQSLHVGVENGSNNFMLFLRGSTEACACMRFLPAPF